jgi:hypothetical protein
MENEKYLQNYLNVIPFPNYLRNYLNVIPIKTSNSSSSSSFNSSFSSSSNNLGKSSDLGKPPTPKINNLIENKNYLTNYLNVIPFPNYLTNYLNVIPNNTLNSNDSNNNNNSFSNNNPLSNPYNYFTNYLNVIPNVNIQTFDNFYQNINQVLWPNDKYVELCFFMFLFAIKCRGSLKDKNFYSIRLSTQATKNINDFKDFLKKEIVPLITITYIKDLEGLKTKISSEAIKIEDLDFENYKEKIHENKFFSSIRILYTNRKTYRDEKGFIFIDQEEKPDPNEPKKYYLIYPPNKKKNIKIICEIGEKLYNSPLGLDKCLEEYNPKIGDLKNYCFQYGNNELEMKSDIFKEYMKNNKYNFNFIQNPKFLKAMHQLLTPENIKNKTTESVLNYLKFYIREKKIADPKEKTKIHSILEKINNSGKIEFQKKKDSIEIFFTKKGNLYVLGRIYLNNSKPKIELKINKNLIQLLDGSVNDINNNNNISKKSPILFYIHIFVNKAIQEIVRILNEEKNLNLEIQNFYLIDKDSINNTKVKKKHNFTIKCI